MRKPIVAGNWKLNKTVAEAVNLIEAIKEKAADIQGVDIVVCPPFTALQAAKAALAGSSVDLGAQNMHWEKSGAFTGEVSAEMLREVGCHYVILGHSERRQYFKETDEQVNRKAKAALAGGLRPIVCVGELLEERESGRTEAVVSAQVRGSLAGLSASDLLKTVVAYEPVWAIGTGRTATPAQAQEVHALIRSLLKELADEHVAQSVRIQYGGSVKPSNAKELFGQKDIDGGLIGGASLEAGSFLDIVRGAL
ncbi:MAG: Bifunctional PGK [Verrucomicrobia bacterium ADurb.Bin345]|nr:MAG: Bifunctional PGK [Verrucomicrobia bacterium ADurb.Bin345]